jgi:glycosyltransferase involved in cell wall biosynthesis
LAAFAGDDRFDVAYFCATSATSRESLLVKGPRLLRKWLALPFTALRHDVVHVNASIDSKSLIRDAGFIVGASLVGRPVVMQYHGGTIEAVGWARRRPMRGVLGLVLRRARTSLFLSEGQRAGMQAAFGLRRSVLVRNGVDVASVRFDSRAGGTFDVLFMSRLEEVKGVVSAAEGFLQAAIPQSTLVIAGAGPLEEYARCVADRAANVTFAGFIEGEEKAAVLRDADCLLLPSRHDEGLPYAVLEALAAGTAVVATSRGGIARLLQDGRAGVILSDDSASAVAAALSDLARDPLRLAGMKRAARALAEAEFSYETLRRDLGVAWLEACSSRSGASEVEPWN